MEFKVNDYAIFKSFDEWGLPSGQRWGQIIDINDEFATMVFGGISLNRTNHFRPNYMTPIRTRPIKQDDETLKIKISRLKHF